MLKGSAVADAGAVPAAPRGHLHPPHLAARDRVRALLRRAHAEDLAVSGAGSEIMVIMVIVASYSDSYCGEREQRRLLVVVVCATDNIGRWLVAIL